MNRRGFLGAILAAGVAPAVVRYANMMPVRRLTSGLVMPVDYGGSDSVIVVRSSWMPGVGDVIRVSGSMAAPSGLYRVVRRGDPGEFTIAPHDALAYAVSE